MGTQAQSLELREPQQELAGGKESSRPVSDMAKGATCGYGTGNEASPKKDVF